MLKLRELRLQNGYSQANIAAILSIPATTYAGWEQGNREPNIEMLAKLAIAFGVTVNELIDFKKIHDELSEDILEMIQKVKPIVKQL